MLSGLRLLAVAPDYLLYPSAEAFVNAKLVSVLRGNGAIVDVVSQTTYHRAAVEWDAKPGPGGSSPDGARRLAPGLFFGRVRRLAGLALGNRGAEFRRRLNESYWSRSVSTLVSKLPPQRRYDFLLSFTGYGHLAAYGIHRRMGLPWIANWNDPFPDVKYPPPYGQGAGAPVSVFHGSLLENVGRNASWHIFTSERLRQYICRFLPPRAGDRSSVIPHVSPPAGPAPAPAESRVFTLCHAGDLHRERSPVAFLQALRDLQSRLEAKDTIACLAIGDDRSGLARLAADFGLADTVKVLPKQSYGESLAVMMSSHVLVVMEAPLQEGIFLPSKFVDYVRTGRPILAVSPKCGTLADLLQAHGGGIAVDCTRPEAIGCALSEMYNAWVDGSLESHYRSDTLQALFSESTVVSQYAQLFHRLLESASPRL